MVLGDFAGRSRRHPTGKGATARSTPRQRMALVPPPGEPWADVVTREHYQRRVAKSMMLCAALVAVGNVLVLWFDEGWLELAGILALMAAVICAGFSASWHKINTDLVIEDRKPVDPRRARE